MGDRICDLSQAEGYCTIPGCERGGCPEEAVCVHHNAHSTRLRRAYCMQGCNASDDCRDGYVCRLPDAVACTMSTEPVLPPGQTCHRIVDSKPLQYRGWCVQGR
jgi:hypothetical protein